MEPRIQYAQTKDGVSIAYCVLGVGPTLVFATAVWGDVHMYSNNPDTRRTVDAFAASGLRVIRYDGRGMGSSDRSNIDYSLEGRLLDLDAVIERDGVECFALCGYQNGGPTAIAYTSEHPERVSHLILANAYATPSTYSIDIPAMRLAGEMKAMAQDNWEFFTLTLANAVTGFSDSSKAKEMAAVFRRGMSADAWVSFRSAIGETDVDDLLGRVAVPTLVVHDRAVAVSNIDELRRLAARIPNAEWVETDDYAGTVAEFVGGTRSSARAANAHADAGPVTVMFTDVEGSTALTQRLGDARARDLLREHERMVREALKSHGGSEVKTMGDGFMASFSSATKALECAIAMQRAFEEHNESAEEPIRVRIGLNAGEPIAEDDDLFGTAVNLAARICAQAEAGQILAPIVVRELAAGKQFMFADLGEAELRGFENPVQLYELRWKEG